MNTTDRLAKEIKKQITSSDNRKPKPYDAQAEVLRVEDGVAWVHIPGGVDETPVRLTINAKKGDKVNIHVANGSAWITGNSTNPPTDDSTANYAVDMSTNIQKDVVVLNTVVAKEIEATNARFDNVEADTAKIHDLTADQLTASVGYIEDLTADNITTDDISAASGYIKDLVAEDITAGDISADHATIGDLDVNYAKVNAANIDSAAIRNAWVDKIMVQTGLLAYSSQIYTLDAIEVNAANITAGTLDVNRLIVTVGEGSSAQKYLINIDPSTGTPSYEKLDGNIVAPRTITADKIVAGAITTNEITTNNLQGTSGWINLHEGKFFYGDGANFASATNAISWNGSKLQIKADEFLLSTGQTIQDSIESVENWFYSVPPTTSNPPASSWTTTNLKEQHLRDIYFDTTSGKSYRWAKEGSTYKWVEIEDVELSALAKDLHDNYPPYSEFTVQPDQIAIEVGKKVGTNEVIAKINASTEGVQIQAAKVDIAGAAVFNNYSTTTQMNTAIGNAVDGIEVGGRNYAVTTLGDIPIGRTETRRSGVTATLVSPAVIKLNGTATSNDWFFSSANVFCGMVLEAGTYACWATTPNVSLRVGKGSSSAYFVTINLGTIDEPYLFNITEGDTYWFTPNCSAGKTFSNQLVKIMIEKGNKATDWTPAPEDVQAEIDAKKSVHTLMTANSTGANYTAILSLSVEGYSGNWGVVSTSGVKVGDTVRIGYPVSDMSMSVIYVVGTVTAINSSTNLTMTSHGLDTTIIAGGNILTNSIGANKIKVNEIEIGAAQITSGTIATARIPNLSADKITSGTINIGRIPADALNSNISIGGRNLLIERNGHASGASFANHTVTNTVADTKTSMQLMIQAYNGSTYEGVVLNGQAVTSTGKYVKTFNSERAVSAGRLLYVKHNGSTKDIGYSFVLSEGIALGEQLTISFTVQSNNPSSVGGLVVKNIQLEKGNVATDWSPAVEDRDESQIIYYSTDAAFANPPTSWVTYTGKNLVSIDLPSATVNGVTYTPSNDYVTARGTINGTSGYRLCPDFTLPAGTYYAWCGGATVNGVRAVFYIGGRYYDVTDESKKTITLTASATGYVYLRGATSGTSVNATLKPMLYSSTEPSDAYEPYIGWNAVWTTKRPRYRSNFPNLFVATQTRHYDGTITCTTPQRDDTTTRLKYVTQIDEAGIFVAPSNQSPTTSSPQNSIKIDGNGLNVYKGGTSVAFYGDTARVGQSNTRHIEIKDGGLQVYKDATTVMGHIGYGSGNSSDDVDGTGSSGTAEAPYYSLGTRASGAVGNYSLAQGTGCLASGPKSTATGQNTTASGNMSHAEGASTQATSYEAHAEGYLTVASGQMAHAEGKSTTASGLNSHAEGRGTTASNAYAHAEGHGTEASAQSSHAEGDYTTASGSFAHAEGTHATASGSYSHAEGFYTTASGEASHAGGWYTIAQGSYQTVIGRQNIADTTSLFIIGKGTANDARANAFSVANNGTVYVNGTSVHSSDRRLKEHISYVGDEAVDFINGLKPAHYTKDGIKHVGFYAQDVAEVDKWDCMTGEMNGYMTLGYMELLAPMVAYIQRLEKRIEELERSK